MNLFRKNTQSGSFLKVGMLSALAAFSLSVSADVVDTIEKTIDFDQDGKISSI